MNQISVADILELPVQERIQLVEVIWESIAAFPNAIEVSPELKTELEARLAVKVFAAATPNAQRGAVRSGGKNAVSQMTKR